MTKHRYQVSGVSPRGLIFISECISKDMIDTIKMYRESGFSVHKIEKCEQVHIDEKPRITTMKETTKSFKNHVSFYRDVARDENGMMLFDESNKPKTVWVQELKEKLPKNIEPIVVDEAFTVLPERIALDLLGFEIY